MTQKIFGKVTKASVLVVLNFFKLFSLEVIYCSFYSLGVQDLLLDRDVVGSNLEIIILHIFHKTTQQIISTEKILLAYE